MAFSFRKNLFEVNGKALCFDVSSCYDAEELESIIEFGGGRTDKRGGQYTISFHSRNSQSVPYFNPPRDLYCSDFILKCCIMNTILELKKYLLKESMFTSDFDPNDILLQKLTWKDAQSLFVRQSVTEVKTFKGPPGCLKINGKVPVVKLEVMDDTAHYGKNNQSTCFRHEFTQNDRQQIIDFFVSNPNFDISNSNFWRKMAEGFSVHTWESLKSHFRNKIYPFLDKYKLSDELVESIRTQMETKKRSRKTLESDSDSDPQPKKRGSKIIFISDEESSDVSSNEMDEQYSLRCKEDVNQDQDESSEQNSVLLSNVMEEIPPQEKEHETETLNGSCLPEEFAENSNSDQEEWSVQACKSPSSFINEILSQEEEHGLEMKSMQDISIQCDYDEATVTDSLVQTESVEVLSLPKGWDYPTTFAGAIELIRSTVINTPKEDVRRPSSDIQVTAADEVNAPSTRKTKRTPSKAESIRRSPRQSVVQQPKKTRSGSSF